MVDFEPRDARDFHGRDGRDGRERRPADHYVGVSHPHFDRRMGHYGLYDYHDAHAAFGGLDRRPYRQQADVYSGVGALHLRIVALRPCRERYVPDFGPCPASFGSGIIQSLGLAIVTREFPPQQRGLALGLWSVAAAASISFGPLIGGYLVDDYSWHLIFDVNVPVGLAAILFAILSRRSGAVPVRAVSTGWVSCAWSVSCPF